MISEEHNVMLIETSINDKYNKEKIAQIMLETFNIKDVYIINLDIVLIYSAFKFTGIVSMMVIHLLII